MPVDWTSGSDYTHLSMTLSRNWEERADGWSRSMRYGYFSLWLTATLCLLFVGCANRQTLVTEEPETPRPSRCAGIFVLAPLAYMPYIETDGPVLLASEGRWADLPVYCTPEEALAAEHRFVDKKELMPGLWRLYQLEGVWEEDVVEVEPGHWRMRRPAELSPYPPSMITASFNK